MVVPLSKTIPYGSAPPRQVIPVYTGSRPLTKMGSGWTGKSLILNRNMKLAGFISLPTARNYTSIRHGQAERGNMTSGSRKGETGNGSPQKT